MLLTENEKKLNIGGSMKGTTNVSSKQRSTQANRLLYCRARRASGRGCAEVGTRSRSPQQNARVGDSLGTRRKLKAWGFALATLATLWALLLVLLSQAGWIEHQGARPSLVGTVVADE
jgi:hypothetical protein